jgi:uncharacterized membrane protein YeiH
MDLRHAVELLGIAAFAASGVLSAGRKRMDLIGVAAIAVVTALGGGTLRDVLLDRHPISWIRSPDYLWVCLASTAVTLVWVRITDPPHRALLIADALGLAFFVIGGTEIAEQTGQHGIIAVVMGVLTGCAGGVIRDVLSAEIPLVLRPGRLYVTAALAGATVYLLLERAGINRPTAAAIGMVIIAGTRFAAVKWNVRLPAPGLPSDAHADSDV